MGTVSLLEAEDGTKKGANDMKLSTKMLAAGAVVVVLAAGAFGAARYASAQTPGQTAGVPETARQQFLDRLAQNLDVTTDQLTSALKTTELQTVDDLRGRQPAERIRDDRVELASMFHSLRI